MYEVYKFKNNYYIKWKDGRWFAGVHVNGWTCFTLTDQERINTIKEQGELCNEKSFR